VDAVHLHLIGDRIIILNGRSHHPRVQKPGFFFKLWAKIRGYLSKPGFLQLAGDRNSGKRETGLIYVMIRESAVEMDEGL